MPLDVTLSPPPRTGRHIHSFCRRNRAEPSPAAAAANTKVAGAPHGFWVQPPFQVREPVDKEAGSHRTGLLVARWSTGPVIVLKWPAF